MWTSRKRSLVRGPLAALLCALLLVTATGGAGAERLAAETPPPGTSPPPSVVNPPGGVQGAIYSMTTCAVVDTDSLTGSANSLIWVRNLYGIDAGNFPVVHGYLRFDLSALPTGAMPTAATLKLYQEYINAPSATISAWRVTQDWSPATLSEANQPTFDLAPYPATVDNTEGWKSWDLSELVYGWVSGAAPNYGVVLAGTEIAQAVVGGPVKNAADSIDRRFRSHDYSLTRGAAADMSPCLHISYNFPSVSARQAVWTPVPVWTPLTQPDPKFTMKITALYNFGVLDVRAYQSINYWTKDGVPLVAAKPTLVRAFVTSNAQQAKSVTATLRAFRGNTEQASCAGVTPVTRMLPDTTAIPNFASSPEILEDLSATFNWTVPATCSWLSAGNDLRFRVTIKGDIGGADTDQSPADDTLTSAPKSFLSMRPLRIQPYMFTYQAPLSPNKGDQPTMGQLAGAIDVIERLYPVSSVDVKAPSFWQSTRNLDYAPDSPQFRSALGDFLDGFESCCGSDSVDSNLALLPPSIFACNCGVQGLSWVNSRYAVVNAGIPIVAAHEIGHDLGLLHRSNDHGETQYEAVIDHGEIGGLGWNVAQASMFIGPRGQSPSPWHTHDVMSYGNCTATAPVFMGDKPTYCEQKWISLTNYARIGQRLQCADPQTLDDSTNEVCQFMPPFSSVNADAPTDWSVGSLPEMFMGLLAQLIAPLPGTQSGSLHVTGVVYEDGRVDLAPFNLSTNQVATQPVRTSGVGYRLELQAADGTVLVGRGFDPQPLSVHGHVDRWRVDETVAWNTATQRIVLLLDGKAIAERRVSATPPSVTMLSPNGGEQFAGTGTFTVRWQATDADGDALTYAVEYSADGGRTWDLVARRLAQPSYDIDLAGLAGTTQGLLRVTANDGVRSAEDISDRAFQVPGKAPFVGIGAPLDGALLARDVPVRLHGLATDREDGMLHGAGLVWSSDKDGALGSGETITARLSPGQHRLTLTATDRDRAQSLGTVQVTVR